MARTSKGTAPVPAEPDPDFLAAYYAHVAAEDLHNYSPGTLKDRAAYHLQLAFRRQPGQTAVGILNELDTSVVAVVADDLPYLVHSVTAELTRDDSPIHHLVHPAFLVQRDPVSHELLAWRPGHLREGLEPEPGAAAGATAGATREVWIGMEVGRLADEAAANELMERLQAVVSDVRAVALDEAAIHSRLADAVADAPSGASGPVAAPRTS